MRFIKEIARNFTISTAVTLGMFTALGFWAGGFGDFVEEKTHKLFNKEKES